MTASNNQLREGKNQITIVGVLKEKDLKIDTLINKVSGNPYEAIMGDITVKVGEDGEHRVKLFAKRLTNAGAESKLFKAYQTIMESYVSIVDIANMPEEDKEGIYPTRLKVDGELGVNDYYSNNEMQSYPEIRGKFITSNIADDVEDGATFTSELYLHKMKNELDKDGIESGRLEIEALAVGYNGRITPIQMKVTDEHGVADYMSSTFQVGDTVELWGNVINSAVTSTTVKEGFGKAKEETVTTYRNEILVNGGEERPLDEVKAFPSDLIQKALAEREIYLQEVEERGKTRASKPKQTAGFGGKRRAKPTAPENIAKEDIPF